MENASSSNTPCRCRRGRLVPLLLFLMAAGWYFAGDSIVEAVDRYRVHHFHYEEGRTERSEGFRGDDRRTLYLRDGGCVKVADGVICYSRSMGHHKLFGLRPGYAYVNLNGRVWKGKGECGSTLHLNLDPEGTGRKDRFTEKMLGDALRTQGFEELP